VNESDDGIIFIRARCGVVGGGVRGDRRASSVDEARRRVGSYPWERSGG
jgi:hypothetical protein